MTLRPLGDRVLVRPIGPPERTESGLHLVEHRKPEQMGVVVAVGHPSHPLKDDTETLADELDLASDLLHGSVHGDASGAVSEGACRLRHLVAREPCCAVGDTVLFSWMAGQELLLHDTDERLLIIPETDLLAVIEA